MDRISVRARSKLMSQVRSKHTKPERLVRRISRDLGFAYKLHLSSLPGRPDLVFPIEKRVVFVHGCFWHQHAVCGRAITPQANPAYWKRKLERNKARDLAVRKELRKLGWKSLVIWECELGDLEKLGRRLSKFLGKQLE